MGLQEILNDPLTQQFLKVGAQMLLPPEVYFNIFGAGSGDYYSGDYDDGDGNNPLRVKALQEVYRKDGSVTVWIGTRETGKTEGAKRQAESTGRPVFSISPEQSVPEWITQKDLKDINRIPTWSTVIIEDLPAQMGNRDYNNALVQEIEKIIPMVRHKKKWHLIFNTQSSAQADKYILDCDLAFFKPQGLLMADVERPNIRKIYKKYVDPFFAGRSQDFIRRHAFMLSRTYVGGIKISRVPPKVKVLDTVENNGIYEVTGEKLVDEQVEEETEYDEYEEYEEYDD